MERTNTIQYTYTMTITSKEVIHVTLSPVLFSFRSIQDGTCQVCRVNRDMALMLLLVLVGLATKEDDDDDDDDDGGGRAR